jgi:hypothetical protein
MLKGAVWEVKAKSPSVIISWHDFEGASSGVTRVWVQSKSAGAHYLPFGSVTVQHLGEKPKPPSDDEKAVRIQLALQEVEISAGSLPNSLFRLISMTEIQAEHDYAVRSLRAQLDKEDSSHLKLVQSTGPRSRNFKGSESFSKFDYELHMAPRTTQEDSIVLAKLYSDLFTLGVKAIPKKISDDWGIDLVTVRTAIKVARGQGWLTSEGAGKSGGILTPLGEKKFKDFNGAKRIKELQEALRGS